MASPSSINNAQSFKNQEEDGKKHSILHTWASSILLVLVLLISLACLLIWIQVHPKTLRFTVENAVVHDFTISSVSLLPRNTTTDSLHATFLMSFSTHNLNHRVTIRYEDIHMTIECYGQVLAFGPVEPFVQEKGMEYRFNSSVSAQNVTLLLPTADNLKKIRKPLDPVKVDVKMHAKASFVVPHWKTDHRKLKIMCRGVMAHFSVSTPFEKARCNVEL